MGNNTDKGAVELSRGLIRLLDPAKWVDYLIVFAIGAWPIACAYLIGALRTVEYSCADELVETYTGYLDQPNWWSLAFLLPVLLFAFRWVMSKVAPVHQPWPTDSVPPILALVKDQPAKEEVYTKLRQKFLSKKNMTAALMIVVLVHVLDMWPVVKPYFTGESPGFKEWTNMFLFWEAATEGCITEQLVSKNENLILLISAYAAQFSAVFIGVISIILLLRHNLFFLGNIYQRRWVAKGEDARFFQIDPKDVNRCFGFRVANESFNTQVKALMIAGLAMFLSRYAHSVGRAGELTELFNWPPVFPSLSFPVAGQWLMALLWLVALGVVALPAFVKLLPRIPSRGNERVQLSISNYLREFFSDETWPKDKGKKDEPVPVVAARFAGNSFWPTGDNRAGVLFFFSYWIFFVILLPPSVADPVYLLLSLTVFGALAYLAKLGTFAVLKWSLGYIDELLILGKTDGIHNLDSTDERAEEKLDIGVFISYRRKDTAEYARSLHKILEEHFKEERVFRDIADIEVGKNFVHEISNALETVDAVIVLIGAGWLTIGDDEGQPRLPDPTDMVHVEVLTALQRGKRVFPVLVGGAKMPKESELPEALKKLAQLNAIEISDTRWDYDVGRLVDALKTLQPGESVS